MATLDPTILANFKRDGLVREGHFAYRSGRHSGVLLDRDRLLADPGSASHMGYVLAKRFFTDHVATVAAPSIWGAGLAQWVGYFLEPRAKVVYATPKGGALTIAENAAELIRDQRVLLIDNLIISGETLGHFGTVIEELGAEVVGVGTLWNSGDERVGDHTIFGLLNTLYESYPVDRCPLCAESGLAPQIVGY